MAALSSPRLLRLAAPVLALCLIAAVSACGATSPGETAPPVTVSDAQEAPPTADDLARAEADDPMALGDLNAPITLVEFTDYSCPYCARLAVDTLPVVIDEYVEQGLVRIEIHDVAKLGEGSVAAAIAARAAGEQGRYFEYLHALYAASPTDAHPEFDDEALIGFAEQAGVPDIELFSARLGADDLRELVLISDAAACEAGIESVPTIVVGDAVVVGAQPTDDIRAAIDAELAEAGAR